MTFILIGVVAASLAAVLLAAAVFVDVAILQERPPVVESIEIDDDADQNAVTSGELNTAAVQEGNENDLRRRPQRITQRNFWFIDIFLMVSVTALTLSLA